MTRLDITRLGRHGEGIGGDPAVYVRRALPGEVVEGEVESGRMTAPSILTPSPERVRPTCRHYKSCGSCDLMHASDGFVAGWKADVVRNALAAHGLSVPIRQVVTSPPRSRRRAVLSGTRTRSGAIVGFHGRGSDRIAGVPGCEVLDPAITAAFEHLEALARAGASRKSEIRLAVTVTVTGLDVDVSDARAVEPELCARLVEIAGKAGFARLTWNDEIVVQASLPLVPMGRAMVVPPPGAFLQATPAGEKALVAAVREALAGTRRLVDLFAGAGTFTLPLAENAEVHAVEGDNASVAALDCGWRGAAGLKRVTSEVRDLFRRPLLADEFARFDGVVIDPPRAGAEAQSAMLAGDLSGPRRIASVSCNPATFARDAAILVRGGYRLDWVDVVDQFRWSPHVELVACLERGKK